MPFTSQKHKVQEPISLPYPTQGENNTSPASLLPEGQAVLIQNFYYDYTTGCLRTRWPFRQHTTSIKTSSPVLGITRWNNTLYFVAGERIFYLDGYYQAHLAGTVGTMPPSFLPFHGYLLIASGTTPQYLTSANVLASITGTDVPTTLTQILETNQSVWGIGNTSYPDYLFKSAVRDETVWSGGTAVNYGLTYEEEPSASLTDLTIIGFSKGPSEMFIISKRGGGKKSTGFLDPNETAPVWRTVSGNECARTWRGQVYVAGRHWMMDDFSPIAIEGVNTSGILEVNQESLKIGSRISKDWVLDENAFCAIFPPHAQIWFFPNNDSDYIWILHYLTGAWTRFKTTGGLKFYSAFYDSVSRNFFLGGSDGNIYIYAVKGGGSYQDNPGGVDTDYEQRLKTAIYDPFPRNYCIVKRPIINYLSLADGAGKLSFYQNFGANLVRDDFANVAFSFTTSAPTMADYVAETMLDKADELLWVSDMKTLTIPYKTPHLNTVQIELTVTSGAIQIRDINVDLAQGRKR